MHQRQRPTRSKTFLKRWVLGEFSWKRLGRSAIAIYACVVLYAWFFADGRIFLPPTPTYTDTQEILKLKTQDGLEISALYLPNTKATQTILFSHGNGDDLGQLRPFLAALQTSGFSVLAYDYRGYGTSQGRPSEQGSYRDVTAAYEYLTQTLQVPPQQIIGHGRSLGGAITIELAAHHPLGGLILESTFVSAFRVLVPFPFLPFEKFHSIGKLPRISCPTLVIHGTSDRTIPLWHGQMIYQKLRSSKQFLWVNGADHNDVLDVAGSQYLQKIQDFGKALESKRL
jgi:abhydrolase domain-containing protein 17